MLRIIPLFILLLTLSFAFPLCAQDAPYTEYSEDGDTEYLPAEEFPELVPEQAQPIYRKDSVDGKALDSTTWRNLTKDLQYGDTLEHKKKPDEKTKSETKEKSTSRSFNIPGFGAGGTLITYLLFAVVIGAILYLLYRLIGPAFLSSNTKVTKSDATFEMLHDDEQMMQKDLHALLEEALQRQDYKTAIRIVFIQSLQDLQTYGWIKWKKEKTNRDYLNELIQREAFVPFGSMILLYEKAWYSESGATQQDWEAFNTFRQQIKSN